jgi:hypothetical protein
MSLAVLLRGRERLGRSSQESDSMRMSQTLVAAVLMSSVVLAAEAQAQTTVPPSRQDAEHKVVQGQVKSIDPAGTGITLTDGTRLLTPPGRSIRPGVLAEGMTVIASYHEENGEKVMTELAVEKPRAPSTDPTPPAATPPTEPPGGAPRR